VAVVVIKPLAEPEEQAVAVRVLARLALEPQERRIVEVVAVAVVNLLAIGAVAVMAVLELSSSRFQTRAQPHFLVV
jgi:hypothetical protein